MNEDGDVNGLDVDPFVAAVVGGGAQRFPNPRRSSSASSPWAWSADGGSGGDPHGGDEHVHPRQRSLRTSRRPACGRVAHESVCYPGVQLEQHGGQGMRNRRSEPCRVVPKRFPTLWRCLPWAACVARRQPTTLAIWMDRSSWTRTTRRGWPDMPPAEITCLSSWPGRVTPRASSTVEAATPTGPATAIRWT